MNEVNIKYLFLDFQKKKIIVFLNKLGLFIGTNRFLVLMKNVVGPLFEKSFQVRAFFFLITEGVGLSWVSFHF
jgi:hypothetical protein